MGLTMFFLSNKTLNYLNDYAEQPMTIDEITEAIQSNRINVTRHAKQEAKNDSLTLDDILFSTYNGEIIADYSYDKPYPSCLIYGNTSLGEPVHSVWAYDSVNQIAILITVYRPDPTRWINWKERRKS